MNLLHSVETKIIVDYYDLEWFIKEKFGWKNYDIIASEEWNNDSSYTITVDGKFDGKFVKLYETFWKKLEENNFPGNRTLHIIMNFMCNKGYIIPGKYLIEVSW